MMTTSSQNTIPVKPLYVYIQCANCSGYGTKGYAKIKCPSCLGKGVLEVPATPVDDDYGISRNK